MKRSAMPRKAAKKRTSKTPACDVRGHSAPQLADGLCAKCVKGKCDDMARALAKQKGDACDRCGRTDRPLDWSHHITRGQEWTRWLPLNACLHCRPCHFYLTNHDALHTEWILQFIGADNYAYLVDEAYGPKDPETGARIPRKWGKADLLDWYTQLKREGGGERSPRPPLPSCRRKGGGERGRLSGLVGVEVAPLRHHQRGAVVDGLAKHDVPQGDFWGEVQISSGLGRLRLNLCGDSGGVLHVVPPSSFDNLIIGIRDRKVKPDAERKLHG